MELEDRWAIADCGGTLVGYGNPNFATQQECQDYIDGMDYLGAMLEPIQVRVNNEPLSDSMRATVEEFADKTKVVNFHASVGPSFLEMSMDARVQLLLFTIDSSTLMDVDLSI